MFPNSSEERDSRECNARNSYAAEKKGENHRKDQSRKQREICGKGFFDRSRHSPTLYMADLAAEEQPAMNAAPSSFTCMSWLTHARVHGIKIEAAL